MPAFSNVRRVPFSARQMFDVVADVERYPEFLPMCDSLQVLGREERPPQSVLTARMGVGYKAIRETFTSRVTLNPDANAILVEYLDGPFRRLENRWRFLPVRSGSNPSHLMAQPNGDVRREGSDPISLTDIDFYVDYEFRSPLLAILMGAVFDKAFRQFAAAFEDRARKVYGRDAPVAGV